MKIICKKGTDIKKILERFSHLLHPETIEYPLLQDDIVWEFSLQDHLGRSCPKNQDTLYITEQDLQNTVLDVNALEYYYNNDALTHLYNRGKYERDLVKLQADPIEGFSCVYIDAVGLHEINNHLGHAAGDHMLCSIAEGIRQNFPHCSSYRIGGDEFVIFCFHWKATDVHQAVSQLKHFLLTEKFEISVGIKANRKGLSLIDTINRAESAMRFDKAQFYRQNGAKRQMRSLNAKLEKMLLEKQDAHQFLNVIASEYKGVYTVNPTKDICRYIYIPEYFEAILEQCGGTFSQAIRLYCTKFVSERDQPLFEPLLHLDAVLKQLKEGNQIGFTYEKKDGSTVELQITIYDHHALDSNEMLWIFIDADKN